MRKTAVPERTIFSGLKDKAAILFEPALAIFSMTLRRCFSGRRLSFQSDINKKVKSFHRTSILTQKSLVFGSYFC
jgi:hypothetical protein